MMNVKPLALWRCSSRLAQQPPQRGLAEAAVSAPGGRTGTVDGEVQDHVHDQRPSAQERPKLDESRSQSGRATHEEYKKSIKRYINYGRTRIAKEHFKSMLIEGYRPSRRLWNKMLSSLAMKKHPQDIGWLLEQMSQYGHSLTVGEYSEIAFCYGKCGDAQRVLQVLEEIKIRGLQMSKHSATSVISSMENLPMLAAKAKEVFTQVTRDGVDPEKSSGLLSAAMAVAANAGDVSLAEQVISCYSAENVPSEAAARYTRVVCAHGGKANMEKLVKFFGGEGRIPRNPGLATFHLRTGDWEKALKCIRAVKKSVVDEDLIDTVYRSAMHDQSHMVEFLSASEHLKMSPGAIDRVLSYFIDVGDAEQAKIYALRAKEVAETLPRLKRTLGIKYVYFCKRRGDDAEAGEYESL